MTSEVLGVMVRADGFGVMVRGERVGSDGEE